MGSLNTGYSTDGSTISGQAKEKVIALTGGAQGIGLELAKLLVSRGALVSLADIDSAALQRAAAYFTSLGQTQHVRFTMLDVSRTPDVDAWIEDTVQWAGKLDGAANVAGINGPEDGAKIVDISDHHFDLVMNVNLKGTFNCMRAQLSNMNDGGSLVCVSSVKGVMGWAASSAYVAAKHGVIGLVKSAAKEEGARNIRVNAVAPGAIDTRMVNPKDAENITWPIKRIGTPLEAAQLIAFLLSDDAAFITGSVYTIDGGLTC